MEGCLFCGIVAGQMPSHIVYQDDRFLAFLDIFPANAGHIILVPKAHYRTLMEIPEEDYKNLFILARSFSLALLEYGAEGVNLLHQMGEAGDQRVPHAMIHVIPRYKSDNVHLVWDRQKLEDAQLMEIKSKIMQLIQNPGQQTQPAQPQQAQQQPQQPQQVELPKPEKIYKLDPRTGGYW